MYWPDLLLHHFRYVERFSLDILFIFQVGREISLDLIHYVCEAYFKGLVYKKVINDLTLYVLISLDDITFIEIIVTSFLFNSLLIIKS